MPTQTPVSRHGDPKRPIPSPPPQSPSWPPPLMHGPPGSQEPDQPTRDNVAFQMPKPGPPSSLLRIKDPNHNPPMLEQSSLPSDGKLIPPDDRPPPLPELFWTKPDECFFLDLPKLDCTMDEFNNCALPLYQAALQGNWGAVDKIISSDKKWISRKITEGGDTVLHVAVANKHMYLVTMLVEKIDNPKDLAKKNNNGDTAFNLAAAAGVVPIAKVLVRKFKNLRFDQFPYIKGHKNRLPLHTAVLSRHSQMAWYLLSVTNLDQQKGLPYGRRLEILMAAIRSQLFDVAVYLLRETPELACLPDTESQETILHAMARQHLEKNKWETLKRLANNLIRRKFFELSLEEELIQSSWKKMIKDLPPKDINELIRSPWNLLFETAKNGNIKVLAPIISTYPDVVLRKNEEGHTIFHIAVMNRQKKIFELIHEVGANRDWIASQVDKDGNNMLHLAAKLAPSHRLNFFPGAALQMQMELTWFKAVEKVVGPDLAECKNYGGAKASETKTQSDSKEKGKEGMTPRELFTKEHEVLRGKGEEWMTKTAESCTLVASLITTVAFAASFTLPGGTKGDSGNPFLVDRPIFMVFAVCNAISLFSSATSILVFLFILTSRYQEDEFLHKLPRRLMIGLNSLSVSIAAMMGAFTTAFFITFRKGRLSWLPIPIALLAVIPVIVFLLQQTPLLWDVYVTTYGTKSLFQPRKYKLFKKNPTSADQK